MTEHQLNHCKRRKKMYDRQQERREFYEKRRYVRINLLRNMKGRMYLLESEENVFVVKNMEYWLTRELSVWRFWSLSIDECLIKNKEK